jgi:quinol monooxygenase YgiN
MSSDNQAITVLGQVRVKARHEADVRAGLQALIESARRESGCISYEMFEDVEHTGSFYFVEEWESQSALHLHVNWRAFRQDRRRIPTDPNNQE